MQRFADVLLHVVREGFTRLVDVQRDFAIEDLQSEVDPRVARPRFDAQPDRRAKGIRFSVEELDGLAGADRALDVDRRRLSKLGVDAEVVRESRLTSFCTSP
jgi:hypothetical protein